MQGRGPTIICQQSQTILAGETRSVGTFLDMPHQPTCSACKLLRLLCSAASGCKGCHVIILSNIEYRCINESWSCRFSALLCNTATSMRQVRACVTILVCYLEASKLGNTSCLASQLFCLLDCRGSVLERLCTLQVLGESHLLQSAEVFSERTKGGSWTCPDQQIVCLHKA